MSDPGPTVADLVDALTTVVTKDAEFKGCDAERFKGFRSFVSWLGDGEGQRFQQVAGQVDMLWVLDVDGQRLLVDATYSPGTSAADRAELMAIVESLRFSQAAP